jgi:hypothetical protein
MTLSNFDNFIKQQPFQNTILIIVFNYSNSLHNKDKLINLYKNYFKEIIVYSDYPIAKGINNVNYVNIEKGFYAHNIFAHFYSNFKEKINDIDGIFYTMDDNIINVNILNIYDSNKIIYKYIENESLYNKYEWHHWHKPWGKNAIYNLEKDTTYEEFKINKFSNGFADYFYLPKKYLSKKLFDLFQIFAEYNVFLEIAIPTIIRYIEPNEMKYNNFTDVVLWNKDRRKLENLHFVKKTFNTDFSLFAHPIKFNSNPKALEWLSNIFQKQKCVIITTINATTETIKKHMNNPEYDVIIVGDKKTPDCYKNENCIYLDIEAQDKFFPKLSKLIPYNHYGRKNLGYLFAIKRGYDIIYETDDDNIPFDNFDNVLNFDDTVNTIQENDSEWINIFKYFTNNNWIWPRGYPLSLIKKHPIPNYTFENSKKDISIINGLVENDPDVDALFRLICNNEVTWEKNKKIIISNKNMCVFNTQNTFWIDSSLFIGLLLPCSVTFRYCDILKGIIANMLLRVYNKNMAYTSPNVTQLRNEHNLMSDFKSEYSMYIANENIIPIIQNSFENFKNKKEFLFNIYKNLFDNNIITQLDLDICQEWLTYF